MEETGTAGTAGQRGRWASGFWECCSDEESCWWGTWCCCLVSSRTAKMFELSHATTNHATLYYFLVVFLILVSFLALSPGAALFVTVAGAFYSLLQRLRGRGQLRQILGIPGSASKDCLTHYFCTCCAVCQEAREAKAAGLRSRDLLCPQDFAHQTDVSKPVSKTVSLQSLSLSSRYLLVVSGGLYLLILLALLVYGNATDTICMLLVLVQPSVILYLLLFKRGSLGLNNSNGNGNNNNNNDNDNDNEDGVSLPPVDSLVKLFFVGFYMTSLQAGLIEGFLSISSQTLLLTMVGAEAVLQGGQTALPSSPVDSVIDGRYMDLQKGALQAHLYLVIFAVIIYSFVVRAGVEETLKLFLVRCCAFPRAYLSEDPYRLLCLLVAGAAGFGACESLLLVLSISQPLSPQTSVLGAKLLVLFTRGVLPLHAICAMLQSAELTNAMSGERVFSVFRILLPSVLLHGFNESTQLILSTLNYVNSSIVYVALSPLLAILVALGGGAIALRRYKHLISNDGWQLVEQDSVHNPASGSVNDASL